MDAKQLKDWEFFIEFQEKFLEYDAYFEKASQVGYSTLREAIESGYQCEVIISDEKVEEHSKELIKKGFKMITGEDYE